MARANDASPREKGRNKQVVFLVEGDSAESERLAGLFDAAGIASLRFDSAEKFLAAWTQEMAGCLVLDVHLPGMSGLALQAKLSALGHEIPLVFTAAHADVPMVRQALKAGAVDFLTAPLSEQELLEAVHQGFVRERAARKARTATAEIRSRVATLSERERQVIALVTTGLTNRVIAERIHLSVVTVKLYRRLAMEKMRITSLAELVKMWEKL